MDTPLQTQPGKDAAGWNALAALVAVGGVVGSLWLSLGMGLKACPLCLYQRAFLMSAAAVLIVGLLTEIRRSAILLLLALPAVAAGLGVAAFHVYLEQAGRLECPEGVFGLGSAPQQSLAVFAVMTVVLFIPQFNRRIAGASAALASGAALLGIVLAYGAILSAPPMPAVPSEPFQQPPDVCRPPYRAPAAPGGA
jgi:disulfide bond formation protein DsbB